MKKLKQRIYLTGYRGTGKTTVGKLISARRGSSCVDLDEEIERAAGKSIREIFDEGGESLFRDWETRCLREVSSAESDADVISLGGGAILREENRELIRLTGHCLWLTARAETIAERISSDASSGSRRPALTELSPTEEIQKLLTEREPLYRDAADLELSTDEKSPETLAEEALRWLGSLP